MTAATKRVPKKLLSKLPHKPSKLIRIAIRDISIARRSLNIDMGTWHKRRFYDAKCSVCFAGAVMHYGLKPPKGLKKANGHVLHPTDYSEHNENALRAINAFRAGLIGEGCRLLDVKTALRSWRDIQEYNGPEDFDGFIADMEQLASEFEAEGN